MESVYQGPLMHDAIKYLNGDLVGHRIRSAQLAGHILQPREDLHRSQGVGTDRLGQGAEVKGGPNLQHEGHERYGECGEYIPQGGSQCGDLGSCLGENWPIAIATAGNITRPRPAPRRARTLASSASLVDTSRLASQYIE